MNINGLYMTDARTHDQPHSRLTITLSMHFNNRRNEELIVNVIKATYPLYYVEITYTKF